MKTRMYKLEIKKDPLIPKFIDIESKSENVLTDKEVIDIALAYGQVSFSDCMHEIAVTCLNP